MDTLGMDWQGYLRFVMALVFVLGLLGLVTWGLKRFGFGAGARGTKGRGRRLGLLEVLPVDARRRLVLLRRDGKEHLIMIGGAQELVIETGIESEVSQSVGKVDVLAFRRNKERESGEDPVQGEPVQG